MSCIKCKSDRIANVSSKASDLHWVSIAGIEKDGYLPSDMGIGGGDYTSFNWCLDCGQIQDKFPLELCALEKGETEDGECLECGEPTEYCECEGEKDTKMVKCKGCGEWTSKADKLDCECK